MHLVPVFTLEMHTYKCLPKFIQTHNSSSSITTANICVISKALLCMTCQNSCVSFVASFLCIIKKITIMNHPVFINVKLFFIASLKDHFQSICRTLGTSYKSLILEQLLLQLSLQALSFFRLRLHADEAYWSVQCKMTHQPRLPVKTVENCTNYCIIPTAYHVEKERKSIQF